MLVNFMPWQHKLFQPGSSASVGRQHPHTAYSLSAWVLLPPAAQTALAKSTPSASNTPHAQLVSLLRLRGCLGIPPGARSTAAETARQAGLSGHQCSRSLRHAVRICWRRRRAQPAARPPLARQAPPWQAPAEPAPPWQRWRAAAGSAPGTPPGCPGARAPAASCPARRAVTTWRSTQSCMRMQCCKTKHLCMAQLGPDVHMQYTFAFYQLLPLPLGHA